MTQVAVAPGRPDEVKASRPIRLSAFLSLSAICSATALAATNPMTACDRAADLQSLDVPVRQLTANIVGHGVVDPDDEKKTLSVLPAHADSAAPILNLAPRVAEILEDIFSAVAIETPQEDVTDRPASNDELPLSPVAGDAGQPDAAEDSDPDSVNEQADVMPIVHRQMYRTDI